MSDSEPFYMPTPDMFGHPDAYGLYTGYAARLEKAGLADRFPLEAEVRHIAIELLAEREPVENVEEDLTLIEDAIVEAREILESRAMDMEEQVNEVLAKARTRAERHASMVSADTYLKIRLDEIEETCRALARMLDKAFAEIEGLKHSSD